MRTKQEIAESDLKSDHLSKPYSPNQSVLITGAGLYGSIGQHIIETLSSRGMDVSRIYVDVTCEEISNHKSISDNCLIMCHGVMGLDWIGELKMGEVKNIIDVNLCGTINAVNSFVRLTINSNYRKKIISIGSMAYSKVLNGSSPYCASKAGVAHFIRCAAWELAPKGYDVYCIHPSNVDGAPMAQDTIAKLERFRGLTHAEAKAYWSSNYLRGRSLSKEEISALVVHLIEVDKGFLSGQQFDMTGGQR